MFDRKELKERAKAIVKKNYGMVLLVSIILTIAAGGGGNANTPNTSNSRSNSFMTSDNREWDYIGYASDDGTIQGVTNSSLSDLSSSNNFGINNSMGTDMGLAKVMTSIYLIILIVSIVLNVFVFAPLEVGCRRWFLYNRDIKPEFSELGYAFKRGYWNVVKIMFLRNLYTFAWTLCFIIPGLIKTYEYRMIPYLLAEDPNMSSQTAFSKSRDMMDGNKGAAFILDASFMGWIFLSLFTCGILSVLWVNPYKYCTDTELFAELAGYGNGTMSDLESDNVNNFQGYDYGIEESNNSFRSGIFGGDNK